MSAKDWFKNKIESFRDDYEFRLEALILDITEKFCEKMNEKEINRSRLAELLSISPPAVTKLLNGNANFTLKTLLSLADTLELDLKIDFKEKETVDKARAVEKEIHVTLAAEDEEETIWVPIPHRAHSIRLKGKEKFTYTTSSVPSKGIEDRYEEAA
jgi:transcriptional regulator with XRE-family HTH domain